MNSQWSQLASAAGSPFTGENIITIDAYRHSVDDDILDGIKQREGFRETPYDDYNQKSIGFGGAAKSANQRMTMEEADAELRAGLSQRKGAIIQEMERLGLKNYSQREIDALTSFHYNTGKTINLLRRFGSNKAALKSKMLKYTKAGGKDLPGLIERRNWETSIIGD